MTKRFFPVIFFLIVITSSCQDSTVEPVPFDTSYFPLSTGKFIIYEVDSIVMSDFFNTTDTVHYQLMEAVDSAYTDAGGRQAFRIVRSRLDSLNGAWRIIDVWSANVTETTAEKVEENLRFIKLSFPVLLNKTWAGNSYINTDSPLVYLDDWEYKYTDVNETFDTYAGTFDSVITVLQHEDINAIQTVFYQEKYAKQVGMIYKEEQNFETQPGSYPNGYILKMMIVQHN
ncbi:MAG: hypothetical protein KBF32_10490 [Chitinophagales bacterium]|nr:hypothetical protein [Chitinophagales bacterium]